MQRPSSPTPRFSYLLVLSVAYAAGCQKNVAKSDADHADESKATPIQSIENDEKTITFAGRDWTFSGRCLNTGDISRRSMSAFYYTTSDSDDIRLIEFVVDQSRSLKEGVYSRILKVQVNRGGQWIGNGPHADWDLDGGRGELQFVNGKMHGTQRRWYPNGRLQVEDEWANGKMHGLARGWYPSGKPQYEAQYVDDKEVSGTAWDENGDPFD